MFVLPLILAAGSLSTLISGAPVPSFLSNVLALEKRVSYTVFGGTGDLTDGWPSSSQWASFDTIWSNNLANLQGSCSQWSVANPTSDELADVKSAITSVSSSTGVDSRFILAIVIQESNGCVRAPTTNYGVRNPGLMQSHDGAGTCNDGSVQNPCPQSEITQMIQDGTGGTSSGDGLQQCITSSGATDDSKYYKAARIYNSGSIDSTKNLGAGVATHCYASDVANRLLGWAGAGSTCNANTIATLSGTSGLFAGAVNSDSSSVASSAAAPSPTATQASTVQASSAQAPTATSTGGVFAATSVASIPVATTPAAQAAPSSTTVVVSTAIVAPVPSSTSSATSASAPASTSTSTSTGTSTGSSTAEKYPYSTASCKSWYTVQPNDYCILVEQKFGVTMEQLQEWNTGLTTECSNLWLGYQYCVSA